jgi:hypothetical protein
VLLLCHDQPDGDRGRNLVALCARPCRSELHALCEDILGTKTDPKAAITAERVKLAGARLANMLNAALK